MDKKIFFQGLSKKTFALILALIFWAVTNLEFDVEREISVPLKVSGLSDNLVVISKIPENVFLTLRGPRSLLSSFVYSNNPVTVDLQRKKQGLLRIDLTHVATAIIPRGIDLVSTNPSKLSFNIDSLITKKLEVKPLLGEPDSGYEISKKVKVNPESVTVRGPTSQINKLEAIETTKINLEGEKAEFTVPVQLQFPSLYIESIEGDRVNVTVYIEEIIVTKEFRDVEIVPKNFEHLEYSKGSLPKVNLVFQGNYKAINNLTSKDIKVFIDGKNIGEKSKGSLDITIDYPTPDLLKLISVDPDTVEVRVKKQKGESSGT